MGVLDIWVSPNSNPTGLSDGCGPRSLIQVNRREIAREARGGGRQGRTSALVPAEPIQLKSAPVHFPFFGADPVDMVLILRGSSVELTYWIANGPIPWIWITVGSLAQA